MARWKAIIDVKDEWDRTKEYGNEVPRVELKKLVDLVKSKMSKYRDDDPLGLLSDGFDLITESVEDNGKEFADLEAFNEGWSLIYDYADANRLWIKTII